MFTGIITDIGTVEEIDGGRMTIACGYDPASIDLGASIAHDGCCLTVTSIEDGIKGGARYTVDVSNETLACTTLGGWAAGTKINLERALALGAELGGHMVTGHVDGVAVIVTRESDGDAIRIGIEVPADLSRFIAEKGSVTLNGTSLTVNEVAGNRFGICLIAHTMTATTWSARQTSDRINLEIDLMARYAARLNEFKPMEIE